MSPSKFRVRGLFRGAVNRVAAPLQKRNVKPDAITYTSLLFAFLAFLSIVLFQSQPVFGVLVFITGFLDGVDGAIARNAELSSKAGALTDSVIDKVAEVFLLGGIAVAFPDDTVLYLSVPLWVLLCIVGWLLTSYTRSRAESLGVTDLDVGLGARSERLLILVVFSLVSLLFLGLVVVTIVGLLTAAYRFHHYKGELIVQRLSQSNHHT